MLICLIFLMIKHEMKFNNILNRDNAERDASLIQR